MKYPNFVGASVPSQSPLADQERLVNWYVERVEGAGAPAALYPTPGVTPFATTTGTPIRALFEHMGRCFVVAGNVFGEVTSTGAFTAYGTLAVDLGSDPATICGNGDGGEQLFVTSGDCGYIFTTCNNQWLRVRCEATTCGAMLDGYFLALDAATSTLWVSNLLDGETWPALWFTQRSAATDKWRRVIVLNKDIWLLGDETSEVWYVKDQFDPAASLFPLLPQPSGLVPFGIAAPWSACVVGDTLMWFGRTREGAGLVLRAQGFQPTLVSTHATTWAWSRYARLDDAIGWSYQDQGHTFYVLTFPTAQATWTYDLANGLWAERSSRHPLSGAEEAWRPQYHAYAFGSHLVGDRNSGTVYRMDVTLPTDVDGQVIRRVRRAPMLGLDGRRLFFANLQLELETGLGNAVDPGVNPLVTLRYSNDAGKTWGTAGDCAAGAQGAFSRRVIWRRLGSGRHRVFEVSVSDPIVNWRVVDAFVQASPGRSAA